MLPEKNTMNPTATAGKSGISIVCKALLSMLYPRFADRGNCYPLATAIAKCVSHGNKTCSLCRANA